jgi:hypothetical protein
VAREVAEQCRVDATVGAANGGGGGALSLIPHCILVLYCIEY